TTLDAYFFLNTVLFDHLDPFLQGTTRLFTRWQQEAIAAIKTRRNQQTLQPLEEVVQYDLEHFNYPIA
ncbi:hypothetical protein QUA35_12640, partial [Microcoleus sp. N9_B2]|uniref:hypothetical protein n=1 Tax=unclassified Microcoleus TaxID=2642155 RepID=UPI002FD4E422